MQSELEDVRNGEKQLLEISKKLQKLEFDENTTDFETKGTESAINSGTSSTYRIKIGNPLVYQQINGLKAETKSKSKNKI